MGINKIKCPGCRYDLVQEHREAIAKGLDTHPTNIAIMVLDGFKDDGTLRGPNEPSQPGVARHGDIVDLKHVKPCPKADA